MAFITSGAITAARVVSTYATKMASEQDIWTMIKNIASNFFKSLNQTLKERGYTLAGAALWGAAIIVLTVVSSYAIYYVFFRRPRPSNQSQDPVDPARMPLEKLNNAFDSKASWQDLETKLAEVTATKDFDLSKRSTDEQNLIKDVKSRITALKNEEAHKQKKAAFTEAETALKKALESTSIDAITSAYTTYSTACLNADKPQTIDKNTIDKRIHELTINQHIEALAKTKDDDIKNLVLHLEALKAVDDIDTAAKIALVRAHEEAEAEKILKTFTAKDVEYPNVTHPDLKKSDIEAIVASIKLVEPLGLSEKGTEAIRAAENEIKRLEELKTQLESKLNEELGKSLREMDTKQCKEELEPNYRYVCSRLEVEPEAGILGELEKVAPSPSRKT